MKGDIEDRMLIRKDDGTQETFRKVCNWLRKQSAIFFNLMDSTGDSYLAAVYLMHIRLGNEGLCVLPLHDR